MKIIYFATMLLVSSCGSSDSGSESSKKVSINTDADAYIEDADNNDNLSLIETECNIGKYQTGAVKIFYKSELANGLIVQSDFSLPKLEKFIDGKYQEKDNSSECSAPGFRAFDTKELTTAKTGMGQEFLYGCGATCEYELVNHASDENGNYTSVEMKFICTNVLLNPLSSKGPFGSAIDKHVGKVNCKGE